MHDSDNKDRSVHYYTCWPMFTEAGRPWGGAIWGLILVAIGAVWLIANAAGIEDWGRWAWPVVLLIAGGTILANLAGRSREDR